MSTVIVNQSALRAAGLSFTQAANGEWYVWIDSEIVDAVARHSPDLSTAASHTADCLEALANSIRRAVVPL